MPEYADVCAGAGSFGYPYYVEITGALCEVVSVYEWEC